jgi:hypothetical protein
VVVFPLPPFPLATAITRSLAALSGKKERTDATGVDVDRPSDAAVQS